VRVVCDAGGRAPCSRAHDTSITSATAIVNDHPRTTRRRVSPIQMLLFASLAVPGSHLRRSSRREGADRLKSHGRGHAIDAGHKLYVRKGRRRSVPAARTRPRGATLSRDTSVDCDREPRMVASIGACPGLGAACAMHHDLVEQGGAPWRALRDRLWEHLAQASRKLALKRARDNRLPQPANVRLPADFWLGTTSPDPQNRASHRSACHDGDESPFRSFGGDGFPAKARSADPSYSGRATTGFRDRSLPPPRLRSVGDLGSPSKPNRNMLDANVIRVLSFGLHTVSSLPWTSPRCPALRRPRLR